MGAPPLQMGEREKKYVHCLNATLTATERTLSCIVENYQTPEGLKVPEVLQPFVGVDFIPYKVKVKRDNKKVGSRQATVHRCAVRPEVLTIRCAFIRARLFYVRTRAARRRHRTRSPPSNLLHLPAGSFAIYSGWSVRERRACIYLARRSSGVSGCTWACAALNSGSSASALLIRSIVGNLDMSTWKLRKRARDEAS